MAKLARSTYDKKLFGICGGIANYFGWDATVVRLIFVIGTILGFGSFILIYFVLLFLMPND
ncbi:PspC domain-containing protein [bacterium]|nr:MAG: PspC domain-containing protein [bacterium]